jgi:L-aminopeptidase/D-esterase-like protein
MVPQNKIDKLGRLAEKAMKEAVKKALDLHRRMGVPAVFMQNGKMVYLMPDGKVTSRVPRVGKARK